MKIIRERINKRGNREIVVELTKDEDGEPLWNSGKTVCDVLADAKQALNHTPDTGKMVEPSEQAKHTLANPPESIYLQVGDAESEFPGEIHWSAVTWCDEPVLRSDLMYIRSDLTRPRKLVRLTESELLKAFTTSEGRKLSFEHERQWFLMCSKIVMDAMQRINGGDQ